MKFRTDRSLHEVVILFSFKADLLLESYLIVGKISWFFSRSFGPLLFFIYNPVTIYPVNFVLI